MDIRTFNVQRFRLNHTTSYTIGSFATQAKNGALGLSPNGTLWANGPGPFSLLHLADADDNAQQFGFRDWQRNGITFTGNADQGYVGQKHGDLDFAEMVIQWSDNLDGIPLGRGPDEVRLGNN
ncbi:MAG: hypothetical protein KIT10_15100 [Flavobacteriales bacterium]|nr:hypothetical protein [Flavobacteriales bacterium]